MGEQSHCSSHPDTPCMRNTETGVSVKERQGGAAGEGDSEVSLNSSAACRWLGDITDLRPNPVTDSYHRQSPTTCTTSNTPTHTDTHTLPGADHIFMFSRR